MSHGKHTTDLESDILSRLRGRTRGRSSDGTRNTAGSAGDVPRRARTADSLLFGILGAAFATWTVRIPAVSSSLGLSSGDLGVALLGLAAGSILGLVASGVLVSRYGEKRVIRVGLCIYCLALPTIALVSGFVGLVAVVVVFGVGKGLVDVASNAQGVRIERGYPGQIMGGFHALFSGGGLVGSALGAVATAIGLSIRVHFALVGATLLVVGLLGTRWLLPHDPSAGDGSTVALPSRKLAGFCAIGFCALFIEGVGNDWSAVFLEGPAGAGPTVATFGFAMFSLAMMLGRFLSDRLVSRFGARQFIRVTAVVAGGGIGLTLVGNTLVSLVGFGVLGAGLAGVMPVAMSMAGNHDPDAPTERAVAAVATAGYGGFAIGPVAIGFLAEATSLRVAFVPALALALLTALLTATLPRVTGSVHDRRTSA